MELDKQFDANEFWPITFKPVDSTRDYDEAHDYVSSWKTVVDIWIKRYRERYLDGLSEAE